MFPWIQPFGCDAASSLGTVYSRQATALNWVRSPVSSVIKYCPFSTTLRNPASMQNLLNLSCCHSFSIRSSYCSNRNFLNAGSSLSKRTSVLIALSTIVPSQQVAPFFRERIHTLHISLRLLRKDWAGLQKQLCEKKSQYRFLVGCIEYRQFTMSFAFEFTSGQWNRSTGKGTSTLSEFQLHPYCNFVPNSLWIVLFDGIPLLFRTKTSKWPLTFSKSSCI